MKAEQTPAAEVRKILFVEKRKAAWGHAAGPGTWWSHGSGWKLCFIAFFVLPKGGDVSQLKTDNVLGRRSVSLGSYHLLGPPAVHSSVL
jgi:hypothetical protein